MTIKFSRRNYWHRISYMIGEKAVKLLDSPGVLFGGSAEKQAMRGALNASALADPIDGAIALLDRCDQTTLALHYNSKPCQNTRAFLAQLAQKRGMVKKGGIPDLEASARQILQGNGSTKNQRYQFIF